MLVLICNKKNVPQILCKSSDQVRECGLYGSPPCTFVPSPPGVTPACATPGKTYCEVVKHYPTWVYKMDVFDSLVKRIELIKLMDNASLINVFPQTGMSSGVWYTNGDMRPAIWLLTKQPMNLNRPDLPKQIDFFIHHIFHNKMHLILMKVIIIQNRSDLLYHREPQIT